MVWPRRSGRPLYNIMRYEWRPDLRSSMQLESNYDKLAELKYAAIVRPRYNVSDGVNDDFEPNFKSMVLYSPLMVVF